MNLSAVNHFLEKKKEGKRKNIIAVVAQPTTKAGDRMAAAIAQAYDSEEDDNDESGFEVDRVDYLQLFSAAITALRT